MIKRFYAKNLVGFGEVELCFDGGFSVFTGSSGAGKSVLMNAILSVFGFKECMSGVCEIDTSKDFGANFIDLGIECDEINVFKVSKQTSTRYFINNQSLSKKQLQGLIKPYISYLSAKENNEISNKNLLMLCDALISADEFIGAKNDFSALFKDLKATKESLNALNEDENKIEEIKEYLKFEIDKIAGVNPKIGELDELIELKNKISKKDKIIEAWGKASGIFEYENAAIRALELSGVDGEFLSIALNELKSVRDNLSFEELSDEQIERLLDRIEALNALNRRYGSIDEALNVLKIRQMELEKYEKIEFEKADLERKILKLNEQASKLCQILTKHRKKSIKMLEDMLNSYLNKLYLEGLSLELKCCELCEFGCDEINLSLNEASFKNISSGELNRLRLAFIATSAQIIGAKNGVLFLDEIDANLSGKEAMSIACVLAMLAKHYQIFAISHQPQLSSKADYHFIVQKTDGISQVRKLQKNERAGELARMISGEHISDEAKSFAKKLLD